MLALRRNVRVRAVRPIVFLGERWNVLSISPKRTIQPANDAGSTLSTCLCVCVCVLRLLVPAGSGHGASEKDPHTLTRIDWSLPKDLPVDLRWEEL